MLARLCNVLLVHVHVHVLFNVFVYYLSRQYWLDAHYCNNDFLPCHSPVVRNAVFWFCCFTFSICPLTYFFICPLTSPWSSTSFSSWLFACVVFRILPFASWSSRTGCLWSISYLATIRNTFSLVWPSLISSCCLHCCFWFLPFAVVFSFVCGAPHLLWLLRPGAEFGAWPHEFEFFNSRVFWRLLPEFSDPVDHQFSWCCSSTIFCALLAHWFSGCGTSLVAIGPRRLSMCPPWWWSFGDERILHRCGRR